MPAITEEMLRKKITEYQTARDTCLQRAKDHDATANQLRNDANTAHGAYQAAKQMLDELLQTETVKEPASSDPHPLKEFVPPAPRAARRASKAKVKKDLAKTAKR